MAREPSIRLIEDVRATVQRHARHTPLLRSAWLSQLIGTEVFLKCVAVALNTGSDLGRMTTVDMDMIRHYRPGENVVRRPPGEGFEITGHHEIMLPLLRLAILNEQGRVAAEQ